MMEGILLNFFVFVLVYWREMILRFNEGEIEFSKIRSLVCEIVSMINDIENIKKE